MDFTAIIQQYGIVGGGLIALAWFANKQISQTREDTKEREAKMFSTLERFGNCMDHFSETLTKIDMRLNSVEQKIDELNDGK